MNYSIGCDAHKKYSVFVALDEQGQVSRPVRVEHNREQYRQFLRLLPPGSPIALEATANWYWMVDEMEQAAHLPLLTEPKKAKAMMANRNKSDKLDARGLAILLHNGTLPTVWIADAQTRDLRELSRMRMALVGMQTRLKNRIHASFSRYGTIFEAADLFGAAGRQSLGEALSALPPQHRYSVEQQLVLLDELQRRIHDVQQQMQRVFRQTPAMKLLDTMPGVGGVLSAVMALEIGDINRFPCAERLISYAGLVPRTYSSGGRTRRGSIAPDVNRTLRWAFVEAASVVILNHKRPTWKNRSLVRLYERVRAHKEPQVATVALARQLAESAFWVLKKQQPYREPQGSTVLSSSR